VWVVVRGSGEGGDLRIDTIELFLSTEGKIDYSKWCKVGIYIPHAV
jgi:hypothetical protein